MLVLDVCKHPVYMTHFAFRLVGHKQKKLEEGI